MQVCVIKNTEPKNINIPLAAATGAAAGLAVRHYAPVVQAEMDYVLFGQPNLSKDFSVRTIKQNVLLKTQNMLNEKSDDEALKLFRERIKAKTSEQLREVKKKIEASPEQIKLKAQLLCDDLAGKLRSARVLCNANIKNAVKEARPVLAFVLPGAALGIACSYLYNVIGKINEG